MGLLKRDLDEYGEFVQEEARSAFEEHNHDNLDSAYDPVEDDMRGVISTARLISGHML